jgi:membrane-bound ClpP family serine protease
MTLARSNRALTPTSARVSHGPGFILLSAVVAALFACVAVLPAQEKPPDGGVVIQVRVNTAIDLMKQVEPFLNRFEAEKAKDPDKYGEFKLILDFNPDNLPAASDKFGVCSDMAADIDKLAQKHVRTIAFVHGRVSGHSLLPVLACAEIVMSRDPLAVLGKVVGPNQTLSKEQEPTYAKYADKKTYPTLVKKLYDHKLEVVRVRKPDATIVYLDRKKATGQGDLVEGLNSDFTTKEALDFDICTKSFNTLNEVLNAYLPERRLRYHSVDRNVVRRLTVAGVIGNATAEEVRHQLRLANAADATLVIVQIECGDGDSQAAFEIGRALAALSRENEGRVETLAYVTPQARNTAALVALGCSRIVIDPKAELGKDFDRYFASRPTFQNAVADNLADLAKMQGYPENLARAFAGEREKPLFWVKSNLGRSERAFVFGEPDPKQWADPEKVKDAGKLLVLSAKKAVEFRLADREADSFEKLCEQEGVNPAQVVTMDTYFLKQFAEFLRDPYVSGILVMVGVVCLLLELKMPGVALPGIVSAICFVLFFWSQSQGMAGQLAWLALLLFVLGILLIGVEVFVMPGSAVCGLSGVILMLGSLGLVAYGQWPRSQNEWVGLGQKVGPYGLSMLGGLVAFFILVRYLPSIPFFNRMILKPRGEEGEEGESAPGVPIQPELAQLLGAIGVAATPLRPAGKVQFGEQFVDVVAEGSYVVAGTRVQVIEIEGNRVVVKEV